MTLGGGTTDVPEPVASTAEAPARSRGPRVGRAAWAVIVAIFVVMAVAVPVKIARKHLRSTSASASTTGGAPLVHLAGLQFAPGRLVVKKGTTVVFDNNDVAPHTVTEDTAGGVDSGVLNPGKSFQLTIERTLVYHCAIHPFMKGRIDVAG